MKTMAELNSQADIVNPMCSLNLSFKALQYSFTVFQGYPVETDTVPTPRVLKQMLLFNQSEDLWEDD